MPPFEMDKIETDSRGGTVFPAEELAACLGGFRHVARMLERVRACETWRDSFDRRERRAARLRKVENLNSGAVPPPRRDRRRLVSGDWLAAGKGERSVYGGGGDMRRDVGVFAEPGSPARPSTTVDAGRPERALVGSVVVVLVVPRSRA